MLSFLVFFVGAGVLAASANVLSLIPWRRASASHWAVRAVPLHLARLAHLQAQWFLPIAVALVLAVFPREHVSALSAAAGAFFGIMLAGRLIDGAAFPEWRFRAWLGFSASQVAQRMLLWLALGAGIVLMPQPVDRRAIWIVCGYLGFSALLAAGGANILWRLLGFVRPANSRLGRIVEGAVAQTGVPVRGAWEIDIPVDYAAALVVSRELVFSRSMLERFSDDALHAICLHELAHLTEPRWVVVIRALVAPVSQVPLLFLGPVFWSEWRSLTFGLFLAMFGVQRLYARLSVRLEKAADRYAVQHAPDAVVYARALESMHQHNQVPVVLSKSSASTHPDVYDRMLAAGVTPDYPRPDPPASANLISICWQLGLGIICGLTLITTVPS